MVDEPRSRGTTSSYPRRATRNCGRSSNAAIRKGLKDGWLRKLYQKYGLWNADQQRLCYLAGQPWPDAAEEDGEDEAGAGTGGGGLVGRCSANCSGPPG